VTYLYENNAAGTLASGITNSATSLTLNSGQAALFPNPVTPDSFFATLTDAGTETIIEIVLVTAVSGNVMSITRAQDGTNALSWNAGDILSQRVVAAELRQWQGIVPIGGIIMWSGAATAIPENWALCNGSSGTPNLEGQFVIGAGGAYSVGQTGGSATALLNHTHTINDPTHQHTTNDPTHVHPGAAGFGSFLMSGGGSGTQNAGGAGGSAPSTAPALTGITINASSTGITVNQAGNGATSLPPYYALCYIMRVN
jgi:hypothetical protein